MNYYIITIENVKRGFLLTHTQCLAALAWQVV